MHSIRILFYAARWYRTVKSTFTPGKNLNAHLGSDMTLGRLTTANARKRRKDCDVFDKFPIHYNEIFTATLRTKTRTNSVPKSTPQIPKSGVR